MSAAFTSTYPQSESERDRWILERRSARNILDPYLPYDFFVEQERSADGEIVPVATILLTNRECPWRCLMCDLWKNTLAAGVPDGAIPRQIEYALARLPPARQIKLYNSGSFFDPRAIPPEDYPEIARLISSFDRVIVESHPSLIGESCFRFHGLLDAELEVAMGLETAHPGALRQLNKRMTLEGFSTAATALGRLGIDLRVFLLLQPPFMSRHDSLPWTKRSFDFAFSLGATAIALIPTRAGNGALDELRLSGGLEPPLLTALEAAVEYGMKLRYGRVFADLWDDSPLAGCAACRSARIERLRKMNLTQTIAASIVCEACEETGAR